MCLRNRIQRLAEITVAASERRFGGGRDSVLRELVSIEMVSLLGMFAGVCLFADAITILTALGASAFMMVVDLRRWRTASRMARGDEIDRRLAVAVFSGLTAGKAPWIDVAIMAFLFGGSAWSLANMDGTFGAICFLAGIKAGASAFQAYVLNVGAPDATRRIYA
jgi:hypothetical protein